MTAGLPDQGLEAAPTAALKERIAELEDALDAAHEHLVFLRNENQSLHTSLDLIAAENIRLSDCLTESHAEVRNVRSRIEQLKVLLRATEGDGKRPTAAVAATDKAVAAGQIAAVERSMSNPVENSAAKLLGGTITF